MMSHKGCRVRRDQSMSDRSQTLQYHWVDRNGWMVYTQIREKNTRSLVVYMNREILRCINRNMQ